MKILIFGLPGSGKDCASKFIHQQFGTPHISFGDILREEIKNESPLGLEAKNYIDGGNLVPDDLLLNVLLNIIKDQSAFILDGYPRTVGQAADLISHVQLGALVWLQVDEKTARKRMLGRKRKDDVDDIISNRFKVFFEQTLPVIDYLASACSSLPIIQIDGSRSIPKVNEEIGKKLTLT